MGGFFAHDFFNLRADASEIAARDIGVDVEYGRDIVMVDDYGRVASLHRDQAFDRSWVLVAIAPGLP